MSEVIEGEAVEEGEHSTELAERVAAPKGDVVPLAQGSLLASSSPADFIEKAQEIAEALMHVVEQKALYTVISSRKHLQYEAWTFLGSMMGAFGQAVFAVEDWTRPYTDENGAVIGWEARVEARTMDGRVVGAAEGMCTRKESKWKSRDDHAIRSMAQTRAASKAMRQPLGFLVQLAGYSATPKEEMDEHGDDPRTPNERVLEPEQPNVPRSWAALVKAFGEIHVDEVWMKQALEAGFGTSKNSEMEKATKDRAFQAMCTAYVRIHGLMMADGQTATIGAPTFGQIREGFASVLDGLELAGPPTGEGGTT